MCLICVEYQKNNLTAYEALTNLREMVLTEDVDEEHSEHVLRMIEEDLQGDLEDHAGWNLDVIDRFLKT